MRIRVRQPYSACKPSKKALFKWASSTLQNNAFLLEKGKIFVAFRFEVVLSHFVLTFPTNRFADYTLCSIVALAAQTSPPRPSLCRIVAPAAQTSPPRPSLCRNVALAAQTSQRRETLCSNGSDSAHKLSGVGKWDISDNYLTRICVLIV